MIGIQAIGTYLPEGRESNLARMVEFETNEAFLRDKIGVLERAVKAPEQKASDLCLAAFANLQKTMEFDPQEIECCVVVTQNPDQAIPHVSAQLHGALGLAESCACFDLSLGCSGYGYGLSVVTGFMQAQGMQKGLLFTADPYSEIVDPQDKNTALIFGDGATVSLLTEGGRLQPMAYDLGSKGAGHQQLMLKEHLYMNGRAVFNFTAGEIPKSVSRVLAKQALSVAEIDRWYFHQGSKYIVDTIAQRVGMSPEKVAFGMQLYGNTVSSSIPLLLAEDWQTWQAGDQLLLSGFGVGLSWASVLVEVVE